MSRGNVKKYHSANSTKFRGVIANILSLVYRVIEFEHMEDATWHLYALLLCT